VTAAVGAVALVASSCNGPLKPEQASIAITCTRADANGKQIARFDTTAAVGVSIPTWVHTGEDVLVQDAKLSGPVHDDDWIVLQYKVAYGSPTTADFLRSPGDDRFDNTFRRKVTGPSYRDFGVRLQRLFIVHPKDGSYVYDDCAPKAGAATTIATADIR